MSKLLGKIACKLGRHTFRTDMFGDWVCKYCHRDSESIEEDNFVAGVAIIITVVMVLLILSPIIAESLKGV